LCTLCCCDKLFKKIKEITYVKVFECGYFVDVCCFSPSIKIPKNLQDDLTKEKAISMLFDGRELDQIEGVWELNSSNYHIAIVKAESVTLTSEVKEKFEYAGLIVNDDAPGRWSIGDLKIYLKKSYSDNVFQGIYYLRDKTQQKTVFEQTDKGVIKFDFNGSYPGGLRYLIKTMDVVAKPKNAGSGSGFFVSSTHIATNSHVVDGATKLFALLNGSKVELDVVMNDKANDLAILKIKSGMGIGGDVTCLPLSKQVNPTQGEKLYVVGFPAPDLLAKDATITEGIVNNINGLKNALTSFQMSAQIHGGNSGGPVINAKGEVIGVASYKANDMYVLNKAGSVTQNLNYAMKAAYLKNILGFANIPECEISKNINNAADVMSAYKHLIIKIEAGN
jgi:S1-C subfamily serine protease